MTVTVLTAIYGGFDDLAKPPEQTADVEWLCVTDGTVEASGGSCWKVLVELRPTLAPRLAAKIPKCLPHLWAETDTVVWLDGSARLRDGQAIERLLDWAAGQPVAQFRHPDRKCIYDEADVVLTQSKYAGQPILAQVEHYRSLGWPPDAGLWATGIIVYRRPLPEFGRAWLAEQTVWTVQDQLSEPVMLPYSPHDMALSGGTFWDNDAVSWAPHRRVD